MITELWHHWLLLRPLLGLVFAVSMLMLAALVDRLAQLRRSGSQSQGAPLARSAIEEGRPDSEPEPRVEAGPREWRFGAAPSRSLTLFFTPS